MARDCSSPVDQDQLEEVLQLVSGQRETSHDCWFLNKNILWFGNMMLKGHELELVVICNFVDDTFDYGR